MKVFMKTGDVIINGVSYIGRSIICKNGRVEVDNKDQGIDLKKEVVSVVINGVVDEIFLSGASLEVNGSVRSANIEGGDLRCDKILGNINIVNGDVNCKTVGGNLNVINGNVSK